MAEQESRVEQLAAPALRSAVAQERARRQQLEQENARLRAGLARQNQRVAQLEAENATLRQEVRELRAQVTALLEQNAQLLQQLGELRAEIIRLRLEQQGEGDEERMPGLGPAKPKGERKPRKKRAAEHNHGRQRMAAVDAVVQHVPEVCPRCGTGLRGGWVHRRIQVIELPAVQRALVTEHELVARRCPVCRRRVLPAVPGAAAGRVGQCRFGPRLLAQVAVMQTVERLPGRQIQARLEREYGLPISHGGIVGLLRQAAQVLEPAYQELGRAIRASPLVQADETGWREDGINGYLWMVRTPDAVLFQRDPRRTKEVCDRLLGTDFGGTLVTDFYAAYDHLPCPHQRCWRHLWRDITKLEQANPDDVQLAGWISGMRQLYQVATAARPAEEQGSTPEAERARGRRARQHERQLLVLCPANYPDDRPAATLIKRCRRYLKELFTFVSDPSVPLTNNAAEQILRSIVVARKISGGTRSPAGSKSRMILSSLAATAQLRHQQPHEVFEWLLTDTS